MPLHFGRGLSAHVYIFAGEMEDFKVLSNTDVFMVPERLMKLIKGSLLIITP